MGKALIAIGTKDQVIPPGVINVLTEALKQNTKDMRVDKIEGVGHELPTWLPIHLEICLPMINFLV
jgi:predicted esterase